MESPSTIAYELAAAFLAGELAPEPIVERATELLGKDCRWLRPIAHSFCAHFCGRPREKAVAAWLRGNTLFRDACERLKLRVARPADSSRKMRPMAAACNWAIPAIRTVGELAAWLDLTIGELDWFADRWSREAVRSAGRLRHYHYRPLTKRFGHVRMIEAPKPRLKLLQRRIAAELLQPIPPHPTVHGFRRGHSILSFAAPHAGRHVVMRLDLLDFFPSILVAQVAAIFRAAGYPETVSDYLAGLCTNRTPDDAWDEVESLSDRRLLSARWRYSTPHLPQGAPTSPALANLCAYRLDCRLLALAQAAGATYTRYADDLAFSGDRAFARTAERFQVQASAIAIEQGFSVHHRKTRIMRQGVRQRLAGIVVNQRPNVPRADYDRLKATLCNCVRHGPASQNRQGFADFQAHLGGRVSFVEMIHPERGRRLRELFQRIAW